MDEVRCPYCGCIFEIDTCEIQSGELFIEECPECEKEMEVYAEAILDLSANKVRFFKCDVCGKKEYEIARMTLPYEKENGEWEYKKLCGSCYWEELKRRREQE